MRKSNDDIPADEMLLAEALAAAKARKMKWCEGQPFADKSGALCEPESAIACCALGAIHFAGRIDMRNRVLSPSTDLSRVIAGNDLGPEFQWSPGDIDFGESLGWAFRCAMTQDEP